MVIPDRIDLADSPASRYPPPPPLGSSSVPSPTSPKAASLAPGQRVGLALLGLGLLAPWCAAALLHPDPRGFGTHQQLGLPPCSAEALFGVRCPSCGMTTAWACLVRFRPIHALRANVGGTLLGLIDLAAAPWLLASALRGRWLGGAPTSGAWLALAGTVLAVTFLDWVVRLLAGWS